MRFLFTKSGQLHGGPQTAGSMDGGRSQAAAAKTGWELSFRFSTEAVTSGAQVL